MPTRKILVAKSADVAEGGSVSFRFGPRNGILMRRQGELVAFVNACTHMGGTLDPAPGCKLQCRVHEAEFDALTGARLSGEAPEGSKLQPIELIEEDGMLYAMLKLVDPFNE